MSTPEHETLGPDRRVWPPPPYEPIEVMIRDHGAAVEVLVAPERSAITLSLICNRGPFLSVSHDMITIAGVVDYRVVSWDHQLAAFVVKKIADRRYR